MIGTKFSRWTVVSECVNRQFWLCRCECGVERRVNKKNLKAGVTRSCGCWSQERKTTHGKSNTRTYRVWQGMVERTRNNLRYVQKGIRVCERWSKFDEFLADMGECPSGDHSLDRIDNARGYEPGNCRWATASEQQRNTARNRLITYEGETLTVAEWAERRGLKYNTLIMRLNRGWNAKQALFKPEALRRGRGAPRTENRPIEYKGRTLTVEEWAVEFGLRLEVMIDRLHHGWSMERIEYTPPNKRRKDNKRDLSKLKSESHQLIPASLFTGVS